MNLKIINWNVRGLNGTGKSVNISNLLKSWKLDVVSSRNKNGVDFCLYYPGFMWWIIRGVDCPASLRSLGWWSFNVGQTSSGMH
jgi:hypothetical protein